MAREISFDLLNSFEVESHLQIDLILTSESNLDSIPADFLNRLNEKSIISEP